MEPRGNHKNLETKSGQSEIPDITWGHELVRPAGHLETYFTLLNDLKLQSNIILSASYKSVVKQPLEASLLYTALRIVIRQHPALSIVTASRVSAVNKQHSRAWEARLKSIDLGKCVQFVDHYNMSNDGLRHLLEKQHNQWFDTEDETKPLWRIIVINRTHIAFVYHHIISDGVGGLAFHKSLLSALNEVAKSDMSLRSSLIEPLVTTPEIPLPPTSTDIFLSLGYRYSMLNIVIAYIYLFFLRQLLPKSFFFFPALRLPPPPKSLTTKEPVVTKLHSFTIAPQTLSRGLAACRAHGTTLTSLITTLVLTTLSTDIYPSARFAILMLPTDNRRHLPAHPDTDSEVRNCGAVCYSNTWLGAYKAAGRNPLGTSKYPSLNEPVLWNLAAAHRSKIHQMIATSPPGSKRTPTVIQNSLAMEIVPEDKETFVAQVMPSLRMMGGNGISLSSLGAFRDVKEDGGDWEIDDVEFSVGAYDPGAGSALYIALVSCVGGGCRVNMSFAQGALEADVVERLAHGVLGRLEALLERE